MLGRADGREAGGRETSGHRVVRRPGLEDALLVAGVPVAVVQREADLDECPRAERRCPLGGSGVVVGRGPERRRGLDVGTEAVLVEPALAHLVEHGGELVPVADLPREPQVPVRDAVVVDAGAAVPIDAVGHAGVDDVAPGRREEPQPVAGERAAHGDVVVVDEVDLRHLADAQVAQPLVPVVRLEVGRRLAGEHLAAVAVAALLRDHVHAQAALLRLGGVPRRGVRRLGREQRVQIGLVAAVLEDRADDHAVDLDRVVGSVEPAAHHLGLLRPGRAADIRLVHLDAGDEQRVGPRAAAGRDGLLDLLGHHLDALHLLHVDDRRGAGDGDRLLDAADRHGDVEVQRHVAEQLDLVAHLGAEAGQHIRDRIGSGPQIDDRVLACAVADGDARAFDEGGAGRLYGNPRQHAAGVVGYLPGDTALGRRTGGQQQEASDDDREKRPGMHALPSLV